MIVHVANLCKINDRWPLTIDRVVISMTLKIKNNNYFKTPLEAAVSKVAGHIPARISDVPSWDAKTIFL